MKEKGEEYVVKALSVYAKTTQQVITAYSIDELPTSIGLVFNSPANQLVYVDDEALWMRFDQHSHVYRLTSDSSSKIIQAINFDDDLVWFFFFVGFAIYCILLVWFVSRRVRALENVTLDFASGNFDARANTSSQHTVGTLNKSFNFMADKVSNLITSNRVLNNSVAHELRTPLFRLQWQADLLSATNLEENQRKLMLNIVEDIDGMEELIEEMLYYAKMERPETSTNLEELDVVFLLKSQIRRWQQESDLFIELEHDDPQLFVWLDQKLIKRVLDNLLRNAMRYADSRILIKLQQQGDSFKIEVHDDGIGIPEKEWPFLFDAFYSADKSRNKALSGFGLGLAIVKQIMNMHSAEVSVQKGELKGACFVLNFNK